MIKVSIIVPVYNVEKYLDKCLQSLVNQTLKNIEIILVNDGSTDNSQKIIDKYVKKYGNVKSYIKENSGQSDTRNYGIKKSSGEYLVFVDSDDYIDVNMCEEMYEKAKNGDYDVVSCDLNYVYPDYIKTVRTDPQRDTVDVRECFIKLYPTVCAKIFKRELFINNNLIFKSGVWYEDTEMMHRLLPHIKKFGVIHKPYYQYIQREKSTMYTISSKFYNYIDNFNGLIEYYQKEGFYDKYYKEIEYDYVRYIYATFIKTCLAYDYKEYLKAVDVAIKNVKNHFPKYRRNKYFYKSLKGLYLVTFSKTVAKILYKLKCKKY